MKIRNKVKIISFLTAVFIFVCGVALKQHNTANFYKQRLYYDYAEAISELNTNLENLSFSLEKSLYATSPKVLTTIAGEIMHEAASAKNNLERIPLKDSAFLNLNKFLTQSGGFSYLLMNNAAEGKTVTEEETETLKSLSDVAASLSKAIGSSEDELSLIDAFENLSLDKTQESTLNTLLENTEEELGGYPSLIYDGPFSDHLLEKAPLLIKDMQEVSEGKAKERAISILNLKNEELQLVGTEEGLMPSYKFEYSGGTVSITKKGAKIVYFLKNREIDEEKLSYEDAVLKAEEYLKKHTDYTFKSSYYYVENSVCTVNFAYYNEGVIYYTDLVKVQVALDNGEIIGLEGRGFIANHHERTLEQPTVNLEEAKSKLPKNCEVLSSALALIPTDNGKEVLCYEFVSKGNDNKDIIIYINANTGLQEDVLILLKTDGGSLTKQAKKKRGKSLALLFSQFIFVISFCNIAYTKHKHPHKLKQKQLK